MKRLFALLLALVLTVSCIPVTPVHAHEAEDHEKLILPEETIPAETICEESRPEETVSEETVPEEIASEETIPEPDIPEETFAVRNDTEISIQTELITIPQTLITGTGADQDARFAAYVNRVFYPAEISALSHEAGEQLTGDLRKMYDGICWLFEQVASGQRTSTEIEIGKGKEYEAAFTGDFPTDEELNLLVSALLSDLAYEQYWFDKTSGFYCGGEYSGSTLSCVSFSFIVAENYRGSDEFHTDAAITGAATKSAANAQKIVENFASKSDHAKLTAYSDTICDLVSYDHNAADKGNFAQCNDPWQLIYAFDYDPTTNIVCEGYAKAYKYLCDRSNFSDDSIACYTVTGTTTGPHMWNIVRIDGKSYATDITAVDSGWDLLLAGGSGSIGTYYVVDGFSYTYDSDTKNQWGTGSDSILKLSATNYVPKCTGKHTPGAAPTCSAPQICIVCYTELAPALDHTPGSGATCTEAQICTVCGGELAAALGHSWTQAAVQDTEILYRCTRCDATKSEPVILDNEAGWPFTDWEWDVLRLVNKARADEGLAPLTGFSLLQKANDIRAEELVEQFSHTRPDGSNCFTVLDELGVSYHYTGENIAAGYSDPEDVMTGWMNSSGHKANILNVNFRHIGVGYHYDSSTSYKRFWSQLFTAIRTESNTGFALVFPEGTTFAQGTSLDEMGIYAKVSNSAYGTCYLPVISEYCSGYEANNKQAQAVTVSVLGFTETFQISRPAHTHSFGSWYDVQAPTCTKKGQQRRDCRTCDGYETREVDALGHNPGAAATCTKAQTCTRCGIELQAALGHNPGSEPTCTTAQSCTRCGTQLQPALGHIPGSAPTCTEPQLCTVCSEVILAALGHTEVIDKAVAPTCTQSGLTQGSHCSVCNYVIIPQEEVPATGHTPGPGPTAEAPQVCTACGIVLQPKLPHIADCAVTTIESAVYTGSPVVPEVTVVTPNGDILTEDVHYTLSYKNNAAIGKASVTVTGMGDYGGKITVYFSITPGKVQNLRLVSVTSTTAKVAYDKVPGVAGYQIYVDGKYKGSTTSTSYTVKGLKAGVSYEITAEAKKESGGTVYYGVTSDPLAVIPAASIAKYTASLSYSSTVYDGTEKLPTVKLKNTSKKTLTLGKDYTVTYENNLEIGKASVIFTGIGKYCGSITKTFTINPGKVTGVTWEVPDPTSLAFTFDTVPGAEYYKVYVGGKLKATVTEPQCTLTGLKTGTTYKVTVKAGAESGDKEYLGSASSSVSAKPTYDLTKCSAKLSYETATYNGKAKKPSVTVLSETGSKLKKDTHYTVSYKANKSIGLATVTVKGKGKYGGTVTLNFEIVPGKVSTPTFSSITGESAVVKWKKVSGAAWYRIWLDGEPLDITTALSYTLTGLEAGRTYTIEVHGGKTVGDEDYCGILSRAELIPTWDLSKYTVKLDSDKVTYTDEAVVPAVTVTDENGNVLKLDEDFTVTCKNNTKIGKASLTVKGTGKYRGSITKSFQIVPAQVQNIQVTSATKKSLKISFDKVPSASTYRIYVNGKLKGTTSKTTFTIQKLKAGTEYQITVQAGKKVGKTTFYGAMSDIFTAATKP